MGSRGSERAREFAREHGIGSAYGSYEGVLSDAGVEAVYVALPNSMHHEWTIKALCAGKHVLCEKPFALSAAEGEEMFDAAERAGRLVVEGIMYRSHPLTEAVRDAVRGGAIGELRVIRSSFCYRTRKIEGNIRFDAGLGGGALMDIGCYCIDFSRLFAGSEPLSVKGTSRMHRTGVDESSAGVLSFAGGILASFVCGMTVQADNTAALCGTEGYIEIPVPWKPPVKGATYRIGRTAPPRIDGVGKGRAGAVGGVEVHSVDGPGPLYGLEADDFAASVREGAAPRVSSADTLGNLRVLESLRGHGRE